MLLAAWRGENPAEKVQAFRETKRKRFLQPDELPKFFCALADEPNETIRDYILLSLVTGARRGNTQAARWNEINFERATWTIPRTKNDEPLDVPLTEPALSLLERRKATSTSEWVFPAKSASGHLEEPKKAWARILHRAGIKDLRLHDLRRTFGAYQACAGSSLPIIGESLGHKSLAATGNVTKVKQLMLTQNCLLLLIAQLVAEMKATRARPKDKGAPLAGNKTGRFGNRDSSTIKNTMVLPFTP